ncbi:hypothetical protein E8E14_013103 [Neopestalotiopsis sp. 37M]|nr:hypothetical protein E8E14_013103 [Neopestalotiopsis sp. 37M]
MDTDSDECLFDYTRPSRSSDWSSQSDTEESKDSDMMDYEYEIKIMDVEMSDSDAEDADTSVAMDIDTDLDMDENDDYDSPTVEMTDAVDIVITMDYETLDSMEGVRYGEL